MRRLAPWGLLLASGCLHAPPTPAARAPVPVDRERYRGMEGYRGVLWGTPLEEVRASMPEAKLVDERLLVRPELVEGRAGTAFYFFEEGHLARVLVSYSPESAGAAEQVRAELTARLGRPRLAREAARGSRDEDERRHRNDLHLETFAVLALVLGVSAAVVARGPPLEVRLPGTESGLGRTPPARSSNSSSPRASSLGDLAYARWLTDESVVEWVAHPWKPVSLITAFSSRALADP